MSARTAPLKPGEQTVEIKLAHSPDSDDAFMFYALATHKLPTPGYKYTHVLSDIQTLNEAALTETYDVTAVSFAAYPSIRDKYILVDCGASFGEGYGPIVVAAKSMKKEDIKGQRIAVPGLKTTAYLSLKLYEPNFEAVVMPFDKILDAVQDELVDAGLLIHEGQLMYGKLGLHKVLDLGIWWQEQTGMPLPLGGNAVRKALGPELGRLISKTIRDSVSYGLDHREDALNTPCNSRATWKPNWPINSSACMSTNGPSATAKKESKPFRNSSLVEPKQESSRARTLLSS